MMADGPPAVPDPAADPEDLQAGGGPLILVVDDFDDARITLAAMLRVFGYRTAEAMDGEEAVQQALRLSPAVILLDLMMPRVDGLEAARRLKAEPRTRGIPIIIVSAFSESVYGSGAIQAGAAGFLQKPVDIEQLLAAVRKAIGVSGR